MTWQHKPPLGTGERFSALESKLSTEKGVHNPAALAAAIGRRIHGKEQMTKYSKMGK